MKNQHDLIRGWLRKAESDFSNLSMCIEHECALDTACFHAQQTAEKILKAYLRHANVDFPFVHNLEQLVALAAEQDSDFGQILEAAASLTPFAVQLRYDDEFWPPLEDVIAARNAARSIKDFVLERLPHGLATDQLATDGHS